MTRAQRSLLTFIAVLTLLATTAHAQRLSAFNFQCLSPTGGGTTTAYLKLTMTTANGSHYEAYPACNSTINNGYAINTDVNPPVPFQWPTVAGAVGAVQGVQVYYVQQYQLGTLVKRNTVIIGSTNGGIDMTTYADMHSGNGQVDLLISVSEP